MIRVEEAALIVAACAAIWLALTTLQVLAVALWHKRRG